MPRSPVDHNTDPRGHHSGCAPPARLPSVDPAATEPGVRTRSGSRPRRSRQPAAAGGVLLRRIRAAASLVTVCASRLPHPFAIRSRTLPGARRAGHPRSQPNRLGKDFGLRHSHACAAPPWAEPSSIPRGLVLVPTRELAQGLGGRRSTRTRPVHARHRHLRRRTHGPADRLATPGRGCRDSDSGAPPRSHRTRRVLSR